MESVGSKLREARTKLGLTLEQVSAKTRISTRNLQALEEDDLSGIPSPFFYRSYVRQFAGQLKLDYAALADAVQQAATKMPEPLMPGQEEIESRSKKVRLRRRRAWNFKWLSSVSSLLVMLIACSSFYAVWQKSRSNWRGEVKAIVGLFNLAHTPEAGSSHQTLAQISPGIPQPPVENESAPADTAQVNPAPPSRLELSASEATWLSIVADGKQAFDGILDAGQTKVLEGCTTLRVRTGNAGGVRFTFNGKQIAVGSRGQTRTVVFTNNTYEILNSSEALASTQINPSVE